MTNNEKSSSFKGGEKFKEGKIEVDTTSNKMILKYDYITEYVSIHSVYFK